MYPKTTHPKPWASFQLQKTIDATSVIWSSYCSTKTKRGKKKNNSHNILEPTGIKEIHICSPNNFLPDQFMR